MRVEFFLLLVIAIGVFFKIMHWPSGDLWVLLSLLALSGCYFTGPLLLYDITRERQDIGLSAFAGMCFSLVPIGVLFKILSWPGGGNILLIGTLGTLAVLVLALYNYLRGKAVWKIYYRNILIRAVLLSLVGGIFYFISDESIIRGKNRDPKMADIQVLRWKNPQDSQYIKMEQNYRDSLNNSR